MNSSPLRIYCKKPGPRCGLTDKIQKSKISWYSAYLTVFRHLAETDMKSICKPGINQGEFICPSHDETAVSVVVCPITKLLCRPWCFVPWRNCCGCGALSHDETAVSVMFCPMTKLLCLWCFVQWRNCCVCRALSEVKTSQQRKVTCTVSSEYGQKVVGWRH
jgi:hypothetical protein